MFLEREQTGLLVGPRCPSPIEGADEAAVETYAGLVQSKQILGKTCSGRFAIAFQGRNLECF